MKIYLMPFLIGLGVSLVVCNIPLYVYWRSVPPTYGHMQLSAIIAGAVCLVTGLILYGMR